MARRSTFQNYRSTSTKELVDYIDSNCPIHVKRAKYKSIFIGLLATGLILFLLFLILYLLVESRAVFLTFMIIGIVISVIDAIWYIAFYFKTRDEYNDETQYILVHQKFKVSQSQAEKKAGEVKAGESASEIKESK